MSASYKGRTNVVICRSNPISPDPRVEKIARTLFKAGWSVTIIGWDRSGQLPPTEKKEFAKLIRLRIKANYGTGLNNLPVLLVWECLLLAWLFLHRKEYRIIHACDFDTILPSLVMKWFFRKKVVYDIFDFYADHLRRTPEWIKSLIRIVDKWAIHNADAIILVDDNRQHQIEGAKPQKTVIIYNTPEDVNVPVLDGTTGSYRLKIAYVGLLQIERGLLDLLTVLENHPEWHLFLAGFGGDQQEILKKAENLTNVHWYGRICYEDAIALTAQCDVVIALYDPKIPNHRYASPNKLFEAMMLRKPIIVAENTNIDSVVKKFLCGIVISYGNLSQLEDALLKLANNQALREQMGVNGRRAYETQYSWNEMSERLLRLYSSI
ncbi:MAG: Glycosyltransferase [Anaerolineae bacterium]|jgi:glycosyltransferase involved in cell wall biosynthesis|nr:MAG: Glycosyltransferase [Anaerolineae bacterium]